MQNILLCNDKYTIYEDGTYKAIKLQEMMLSLVSTINKLKRETEVLREENSMFLDDIEVLNGQKEDLVNHLREEEVNKIIAKSNLTSRELLIMGLIAEGKTNQEIGEELCISPNTVRGHLDNIYDKYKLKKDNSNKRIKATLIYLGKKKIGED